MNRYIALLRGINVSGQKMVAMDSLKSCLESNGFENVGRAKMNNNFFEQKLKVDATTRNLNTLNRLVQMAKFRK